MSDPSKNISSLVKQKLVALLPDKDGPLLVALSGGCDSIALAKILIQLEEFHGRDIYAYHLDHGFRGDESQQDADFVKKWCDEKSIKVFIEKAPDLDALRKRKKYSLEEIAREYRYERLTKTAKDINAAAILTGHTMDDDIETFLLRMFTGASVKALSGIKEKTSFDGIPVIRPLLECTKDELKDFLKTNIESWREDRTNYEPDTLRNKVRLEVLPFLENLFDRDIKSTLGRTLSNIKRETVLLERLLQEDTLSKYLWIKFETEWKQGFVIKVHDLESANPALRFRILLWALNELDLSIKRRKISIFKTADDFINLKGGKKAHHVGEGIYIARSGKAFLVARTLKEIEKTAFDPGPDNAQMYISEVRKMSESMKEKKIAKPGTYKIGDFEILVETVDETESTLKESKTKDVSIEYFDPSILEGGIELVYGATITQSEKREKDESEEFKEEYRKLGNRSLVDNWVKWPVIKKKDEVIWIVGVCRRNVYDALSGKKAIKISAKIPGNMKVFT